MTALNEPAQDRFLLVAEVATELRVSVDTVRRWINAGKLPAVAVSARDYRVERSDYDRLVENMRVTVPLVVEA